MIDENFDLLKKQQIRTAKSRQRIHTKSSKSKKSHLSEKGTVISILGTSFFVELILNSEIVDTTLSGTVITNHSHKNVVVVGDVVEIEVDRKHLSDAGFSTGMILKVEQRKSYLSRRSAGKSPKEHLLASNADILGIVISVVNPDYNKKLIDRMLIAAFLGNLTPVIIVNKIDGFSDLNVFDEDLAIYKKLDIEIRYISCKKNIGISELKNSFANKTVILSGQSGVGKSSLVNKLVGESVQFVNIISERTLKGQHTTSFVKLFRLDDGINIIDTPGIREFGIFGVQKLDLCYYYDEFEEYFQNCKYLPCTHTHEPDCAVIEALNNGLIDADRYDSYRNILESLD